MFSDKFENCSAKYDVKTINDEKYSGPIGSCEVSSSNSVGSCENEGFIKTSFNAVWKWATTNGEEHDPNGEAALCRNNNGERIIPCPVRLKLSFFGVIEFVVAIILIALIYFVIRDLFSKRKVPEEKIKTKKVLKNKVAKKKK